MKILIKYIDSKEIKHRLDIKNMSKPSTAVITYQTMWKSLVIEKDVLKNWENMVNKFIYKKLWQKKCTRNSSSRKQRCLI